MMRRVIGGLLVTAAAATLVGGSVAALGWRDALVAWLLGAAITAALAGGLALLSGGTNGR